jgi:hypothetical protein
MNYFRIFVISFFILQFFACSHNKSIDNQSLLEYSISEIDSNKGGENLKVGRKITNEDVHIYIRQWQLPPYRTDTTPQRILLIGDSMSKWLRYRLQDYCEKNGHQLSTVTWVSGNTEWFAQSDTLSYYLKKDSISYVILVLGSNELFVRDFGKYREKYVDTIVNRLSEVKWVWVGPPNWKKDKGINDFLFKKLGEEKFFLSKDLKFRRRSDGMHPTTSSCSMWVDSVVSWIKTTSTSKIKLNVPDSSYQLKPEALVLRPL